MKLFSLILASFLLLSANIFADTIIWSGEVNSNGTPTTNVKLELGKKYQIKVSGMMNLGKWWKGGVPLMQDACYEFNALTKSALNPSLKNSLNISVCNGNFHQDHLYQSLPFIAAQSAIHFWIYDTDYSDNSGALQVQVINLTE